MEKGYFAYMQLRVINNQKTCANIMKKLKLKGYTPIDVKERLHLECVQTVYKWRAAAQDRKKQAIPSIDNLFLLADMLECTVDDLVVLNDIEFSMR